MTARPSGRPTKQDLELILEKIRPRIEDVLQRHGCAPETAVELIGEAVIALTHRWSRVRDREQWLLDRIEKTVRRTVNLPPQAVEAEQVTRALLDQVAAKLQRPAL